MYTLSWTLECCVWSHTRSKTLNMIFVMHLSISSCNGHALNCWICGFQCRVSEWGAKPSWKDIKQPNKVLLVKLWNFFEINRFVISFSTADLSLSKFVSLVSFCLEGYLLYLHRRVWTWLELNHLGWLWWLFLVESINCLIPSLIRLLILVHTCSIPLYSKQGKMFLVFLMHAHGILMHTRARYFPLMTFKITT